MRCKRVRQLLVDYMEDVVSFRKRKAIERHLSDCEDCERELRAIEKTKQDVLSLGILERDSEFWERFNTKLSQRIAEEIPETAPRTLPVPRVSAAGAVFAALLILICGALIYRYSDRGEHAIEPLSQPRLAESAETVLPEPADILYSPTYDESMLALSYLDTDESDELFSELVIEEEGVSTLPTSFVLNDFYEPAVDDFVDEMSAEEIDTLYESLEFI